MAANLLNHKYYKSTTSVAEKIINPLALIKNDLYICSTTTHFTSATSSELLLVLLLNFDQIII